MSTPRHALQPSAAPDSVVPIATPGRNCWRRCRADRLAFVVDSAAYFAAVHDAISRARQSVYILGWDFDSRIALRPGEPRTLGELLADTVRARRGLHAFVLGWAFPRIFAGDREPQPVTFGHRTPRRLHYHLDATYSGLASCHQKIVVVDDALAFVGGMDLTNRRWDTPEHLAHDPRRIGPDGLLYPPVHDVMMALDGEAARAMGELARERWRTATGYEPKAPRSAGEAWPPDLPPDATGATVAFSRTLPSLHEQPPVREVEQMFLDTIAAARKRIYIENQFFTSSVIGEALARRLAEPDGPEVVVVISREAMSWLEESTMGVLRVRLLRDMRQRDPHGRFAIYDPVADGPDRLGIKVHAKVLIADDTLLRIGSANLNNRSLGLDPECDVTLEALGDPSIEQAIAGFRDRLIAEHLGTEPDTVRRAVLASGSLVRTIDALRGDGRTLELLSAEPPEWLDEMLPGEGLIDPDTPLETEAVIGQLLPSDAHRHTKRPLVLAGVTIAIAAGLLLLWKRTPFGAWVAPEHLAQIAAPLGHSPLGAVYVAIGYFLIGLLFVPVNLLMLATALAFGPWLGLAYSVLGFMVSAAGTYAVGALVGKHAVGRLAGERLHRVAQRLDRHGVLAIAALRAIPVAPYTLVNLIAGASRVRFVSYLVGTFLGMLPGTIAITLFGGQLGTLFSNPSPGRIAFLVFLLLVIVGSAVLLPRLIARPRHDVGGPEPGPR